MKISTKASHKVENMSLLCAILVVTIHVGWSDQVGSIGWYIREFVKSGIAKMAVPFFFVVSGYFLSFHFAENGWWRREIKKRTLSLAVPFFLWLAIGVILITPQSIIADKIANRPFGESCYWLHSPFAFFGFDLSQKPGLVPLWYIRCLFLFVIISPFVRWFVDKCHMVWIASVFVLTVAKAMLNARFDNFLVGFCAYGISIEGLVYFSLGMIIRDVGICATKRLLAELCLLVANGIILLKVFLAIDGRVSCLGVLRELAIPFALYGIWHYMPTKTLPACLRGCSFAIYLMHMIVLSYLGATLKFLPVDLNDTISSIVLVVGGVAVPIIFCNWLRKHFPRTAKILFCGRM